MPVDSKELLNNVGEKMRGWPVVATITKNPFYTACLIVLVFILVTVVVFRDVEGVAFMAAKVGVYSLIFVTGLQFLQNKNIMDEYRETKRSEIVEQVFDSAESTRGGGGIGKINMLEYIPPVIDPVFTGPTVQTF